MDWMIKSEIRENNRVLQNLKDAMKQRNLTMMIDAKKKLVRVPLKEGRTLHHDMKGHFGAGRVVLRSAPAGTGIIAGGPMRAVFETLGVQDVVSKSIGSSSPYNMVRATFNGLVNIQSPRN